jgi:hypothetical protein
LKRQFLAFQKILKVQFLTRSNSTLFSGKVCAMASAHSGRFACAFLPETSVIRDMSTFAKNLSISLYECESSGGVEWLQEERLNLGRCFSNKEFLDSILWNSSGETKLSKFNSM